MDIGKFYFCKKDEVIKTLKSNNVKLFLSTDSDDIYKALHAGKQLNVLINVLIIFMMFCYLSLVLKLKLTCDISTGVV